MKNKKVEKKDANISLDIADDLYKIKDCNKIKEMEEVINKKKDEIKNKTYQVNLNFDKFKLYEEYILNDAEWNSTEALGIKEISKIIEKINKKGIENSTIHLDALALEASHYFILKMKGKGIKSAEKFLELYIPFDKAISEAKKDSNEIKELQMKLDAAIQGIELE